MWSIFQDQIDREHWNHFVFKHGPQSGAFLQSWEWGEFQQETGERVVRWIMGEKTEQKFHCSGVATVLMKPLSHIGTYAYCPRGPIIDGDFSVGLSGLLRVTPSMVFFRSDIPSEILHPVQNFWNHKTQSIQPALTRLTSLADSEQTLLASLPPKTRYNIRLAERRGVRIRFDRQALEDVWPLFEGTSSRGQFRLHKKAYYQRMLATLATASCRAFLATAWFEDRPIAANLMLDFGSVRTYLHGASSYEHRALMAPHLLHWQLLNDARQNGLLQYDWWGVAPLDQPRHTWSGISRFKRAFPGEEIAYLGTFDLVKQPVWYTLYQLVRRLRRIMTQ